MAEEQGALVEEVRRLISRATQVRVYRQVPRSLRAPVLGHTGQCGVALRRAVPRGASRPPTAPRAPPFAERVADRR